MEEYGISDTVLDTNVHVASILSLVRTVSEDLDWSKIEIVEK